MDAHTIKIYANPNSPISIKEISISKLVNEFLIRFQLPIKIVGTPTIERVPIIPNKI